MHAFVNGNDCELPNNATVAVVVELIAASPRGCAVAVNGSVVPKSTWQDVAIEEGDRVEILSVAPGG